MVKQRVRHVVAGVLVWLTVFGMSGLIAVSLPDTPLGRLLSGLDGFLGMLLGGWLGLEAYFALEED
jgi:hypothetical protein